MAVRLYPAGRGKAESPYPLNCPMCQAKQGRPVRVTAIKAQPGQYKVEMICSACKYLWRDATNALVS